jgi:hypothetical protein
VVPYRIYATNLRKTMENLRGNSIPAQARSVGLLHTNLTAEAKLSVYQTKGWTELKLQRKRIKEMTEDTKSTHSL